MQSIVGETTQTPLFDTDAAWMKEHEAQFKQAQGRAQGGLAHQRASWVLAGVAIVSDLSAPGGWDLPSLMGSRELFAIAVGICAVAAWRWGRRERTQGLGDMVRTISHASATVKYEHRGDTPEQKANNLNQAREEARSEGASAFAKLAAHHYVSTLSGRKTNLVINEKTLEMGIDTGVAPEGVTRVALTETQIGEIRKAAVKKKGPRG